MIKKIYTYFNNNYPNECRAENLSLEEVRTALKDMFETTFTILDDDRMEQLADTFTYRSVSTFNAIDTMSYKELQEVFQTEFNYTLTIPRSKSNDVISTLLDELGDAISFMELFDKDDLGYEDRVEIKHNAFDCGRNFLTDSLNQKTNQVKVKVFRFKVSNASSHCLTGDENQLWYRKEKAEIVSEKQIESTINQFLIDKELINLQISPVEVNYHNNARGNTIDLIYTITYK